MKWLYWHKSNPDIAGGSWVRTAEEERALINHPKTGYNPQLSTWKFALNADVTSGWGYIQEHIAEYDAVFLDLINFTDKQKHPLGIMRTRLCRKHNPNIIIVASYDSWCGNPNNISKQQKRSGWRKQAIDMCDLVFATSNAWESHSSKKPMMWNNVYGTDKFTSLLAPFDVEYLSKFQKSYSERLKHVISCSPVNYCATQAETAKVLKLFLPSDWKAGLTHIKLRPCPHPFYKLGNLVWQDYIDWISKSYMGVFNAHHGGLASIAGLGAVLKTPFVGSLTADYIITCFPDLVKDYKNYKEQAELCKRLIEEESFWKEMTERGCEICKRDFSFEGGKRRLYDELKKRDII